MKLYFSPGACSLSPHIALREANLAFELEPVSLATHKTKSGVDYFTINPKGYVPALQLDDGQILTEGPAIVQYIADQRPASKLAPPNGTLERYRLQEWLNFISTELHKQFSPLFNAATPEETKKVNRERIGRRLEWIDKNLEVKPYLMGENFTVADGYLFVMLTWCKGTGVDLSKGSNLRAYFERVGSRPSVRAAQETEKAAREKLS
jgi:glutathione S-transferase